MVEVSVLTENEAKNIDSQAKLPGAGHGFHLLLKIRLMRSTARSAGTGAQGIAHRILLPVQVAGLGQRASAEQSCVVLLLVRELLAGSGFLHQCEFLQLPPLVRLRVWADGQQHGHQECSESQFFCVPPCSSSGCFTQSLRICLGWGTHARQRSPGLAPAKPRRCRLPPGQFSCSREQQQVPALARPPGTGRL